MTALQKIIKTAKGLQKKNKSLAWKDAIKKAGVIYRKEKKPVKSAKMKKAIGKKPVVKKAVKKKAIYRPGKHTDTKSHNVNIRVVSGTDNYSSNAIKLVREHNFEIDNLKKSIAQYEKALRENKKADLSVKNKWRKSIQLRKGIIAVHKKGIAQLKKYI
jgi:hypothetical protein